MFVAIESAPSVNSVCMFSLAQTRKNVPGTTGSTSTPVASVALTSVFDLTKPSAVALGTVSTTTISVFVETFVAVEMV